MSTRPSLQTTAAARYDTCLSRARHGQLPPEQPLPQPTSAWPAENVTLLERYHEWLHSGGASPHEIDSLYIPMAGHVLGLNLKTHAQLDLDADLARAFDYVRAKSQSAEWTSMCRTALARFRTFLRQQRGAADVDLPPLDLTHYHEGLPAWLVTAIERYQRVKQGNWRPARLEQQIRRFWLGHTRIWRWLAGRVGVRPIGEWRPRAQSWRMPSSLGRRTCARSICATT